MKKGIDDEEDMSSFYISGINSAFAANNFFSPLSLSLPLVIDFLRHDFQPI